MDLELFQILFQKGMGWVVAAVIFREWKVLQAKMEQIIDRNIAANDKLAENLMELRHVVERN